MHPVNRKQQTCDWQKQQNHCNRSITRHVSHLWAFLLTGCFRAQRNGRWGAARGGACGPLLSCAGAALPGLACAVCTPTRTGHLEPERNLHAAGLCPSYLCWIPAGPYNLQDRDRDNHIGKGRGNEESRAIKEKQEREGGKEWAKWRKERKEKKTTGCQRKIK